MGAKCLRTQPSAEVEKKKPEANRNKDDLKLDLPSSLTKPDEITRSNRNSFKRRESQK